MVQQLPEFLALMDVTWLSRFERSDTMQMSAGDNPLLEHHDKQLKIILLPERCSNFNCGCDAALDAEEG